jgi:hypothetical protein
MFYNKYFIIRKGDFATDGNKKLYYTLFSMLLCFDDYLNESIDCFKIMVGSTFVWTLIEFALYYSSTRVMKPMYFTDLYNNKYLIPRIFSIILQGSQEGGVVTTFGLYFGDRLYNFKHLLYLHMFIGYIIFNMSFKQNISKVASKRQINSKGSLLTMGSITLYNVYNLYLYPNQLNRQMRLLFVMVYVCSIWTYIAYLKGFRGVESRCIINGKTVIEKKSIMNTFLILGYDVFFEIGVAYLSFYNWFI